MGYAFDYWSRQLPVIGGIYGVRDNYRYFADYQKNTGYRARYPGRSYGTSGLSHVLAESGEYGRMLNRVYSKM